MNHLSEHCVLIYGSVTPDGTVLNFVPIHTVLHKAFIAFSQKLFSTAETAGLITLTSQSDMLLSSRVYYEV